MRAHLLSQTVTLRDPRTTPITATELVTTPGYIEIAPWSTVLRYEGPRRSDLSLLVRYTQAYPSPDIILGFWPYDSGVRIPGATGYQDTPAWSRRVETEVALGQGHHSYRYILTGAEIRLRASVDSITVRARLTHHVRHMGPGGSSPGTLDPVAQPWYALGIPDIVASASVSECADGVTEDALVYTDTVQALTVGVTYISPVPPWARRVRVTSGSTTTVWVTEQRSVVAPAATGQVLRSSASQATAAHDAQPDQILVPGATHVQAVYTSGGAPQLFTFTYSGRIVS